MLPEESDPVASPKLATSWQEALKIAVIFQAVFGLAAAMILDGGGLLRCWAIAMAAWWPVALMMMSLRRQNPTRVDLFLIRWSFPMIFPWAIWLADAVIRHK